MMGGEIKLESRLGKGSTFHFTARLGIQPTRSSSASSPSRRSPRLEDLQNVEVLIVDDNSTNRKVFTGLLTRWGMRPVAVEGGQAALEALQNSKTAGRAFSLILLDREMQKMDGFAIAGRIREDPGWSQTPMMMLTSASRPGDSAHCAELRISSYLVKPVDPNELRRTVWNVLQSTSRPKEPGPAEATSHVSSRRFRILLAEDNPVNRKLALRLLEKRGYEVAIAQDGPEVLAELEKQDFDAVLLDAQVAGMSGCEAAQAIREREQFTGGHLAIVGMLAQPGAAEEQRALAAGMDACVAKPIRPHEFFATIEKLLRPDEGAASESRTPAEDLTSQR